jgi:hypothetical protein
MSWEEIGATLNYLLEIFIDNWWKILSYSFALLLSLPIIRWFILSVLYLIFKTPLLLEKFGESTAFNLIPWWINLLIDFPKTLFIYCLLVILVTCIFGIINRDR